MNRRAESHDEPRSPYRRKKNADPQPAHIEAQPHQPPMVVDADGSSRQMARPLGELARAFAVQAEVLKAVHDNQVRLQEKMEDDDRSEVMLSSTKALNETFRGVRNTQRELADRLEETSSAKRRWRAAGLVAMCLFAGALTIVIQFAVSGDGSSGFDYERETELLARITTSEERESDERRAAVQARSDTESARSGERLAKEELARARTKSGEVNAQLIGEKKRGDELQSRIERARDDAESTIEREKKLGQEVARLEVDVDHWARKYGESAERYRRLENEFIAQLKALPAAGPGSVGVPPIVSSGGAEELPVSDSTDKGPGDSDLEKPVGTGDDVATRPESAPELDDLMAAVNALLGTHRSSNVYRLESVKRVEGDRLIEVVVTESAPGKGVLKTITAEDLQLVVTPQGDIVELDFRVGNVQPTDSKGRPGRPVPFYKDRYRLTVYSLNGDAWLGSEHPFVVVK